MDSAIDNAFYVHVSKDKKVRFGRDEAYVYTHVPTKLGKKKNDATKTTPESGCFVQSVEENKLFYTPREVNRAKRARELLIATGSPSTADLKVAIATNAIANNPVVTEDIALAENIFGKDVGTLKGKTVKSKSPPKVSRHIAIPPEIGTTRDSWVLYIDVMFVNKIPFLTSISGALYYRTAIPMKDRTAPELYATIDKVFRIYNGRGFVISDLHADNEFRPLLKQLCYGEYFPIPINLV